MNRASITLPIAVIVLLLASANARQASRYGGDATRQEQTEVVLIATIGADHLVDPEYSPAHLRALLHKIRPDGVAIKNIPLWQQAGVRWHPARADENVAISWAQEFEVPVYGVEAPSPQPGDGWDRRAQGFRNRRESVAQGDRFPQALESLRRSVIQRARVAFGETSASLDRIHSDSAVRAARESLQTFSDDARAQMEASWDSVAENILSVVGQHSGGRIAVFHAAFNYPFLYDRLQSRLEVKLLPVQQFLPITSDELEAAWHLDDLIMILGANLDAPTARAAPHSRNHQRTKLALDRLERSHPRSAPALYYRARWHMLFGDWDRATPLLEAVRGSASDRLLPFPPARSWRWPPLPTTRDMATFALATLWDLRGEHSVALPYYRELLDSIPIQQLTPRDNTQPNHFVDLQWYLRNLIEKPYEGGAAEFARYVESQRAYLWEDAPAHVVELIRR